MTDQSKTTTDMPDVIYATQYNIKAAKGASFIRFGMWSDEKPETGNNLKFVRADLVPAAPTGDKAAALDSFNAMIEKGLLCEDDEGDRFYTFNKTTLGTDVIETIRAALQGNTAPDDLVKAVRIIELLNEYTNPLMQPDKSLFHKARVEAQNFLAAHKAKTKVQE